MTHPQKKLGEVCEIVTGSTPRTSVSAYYGGDILWAGPTDLDQGVYVTNTQKKLTKKGVEEGGARLIPKNSVMVSCIGYIGKIAMANENMTTNQQINTFSPKIKSLDSKYLYYALIFKSDEFKKSSSQTTLPIINKTKCSNIEIPLPPLSEQKKIVARLEGLLGKIKEAKRLRAESETAVQNLLPAELHKIFEEGKKIGWEEKELEEICDFQSGLWKAKRGPAILTRVLRNTNFKNNDGTLNYGDVAEVEVEAKQLESRILERGDIILERSGGGPDQPVGRVVYFDNGGEFSFSNFTTRLRKNIKDLDSRYLFHFLNHCYMSGVTESLQKQTTGIRNLMFREYKKIKIPLPPVKVQQDIVKRLDALSQKVGTLKSLQESQDREFKKLEQSLLHQAFSREFV